MSGRVLESPEKGNDDSGENREGKNLYRGASGEAPELGPVHGSPDLWPSWRDAPGNQTGEYGTS